MKEKFKKTSKNKKVSIIFGCLVLLCILFITIISLVNDNVNWNASKIIEKMQEKLSSTYGFKNVSSQNQLYTSKAKMQDMMISDYVNLDNEEWAISIEVFENNQKSKIRYEYLEWGNAEFSKMFTKEDYGTFYDKILWDKTYNYLDGNVILRLNYHYSESAREQILNVFNEVEDMYKQKEKNVSSENNYVEKELEKLKDLQIKEFNGYKVNLENKINDIVIRISNAPEDRITKLEKELIEYAEIPIIKEAYDNAVLKLEEKKKEFEVKKEENANSITSRLDKLKTSLDKTELENIQNEIELLSDAFYDKYKDDWTKKIIEIEEKINEKEISDYKKECKNLNYKNILRNPDDYLYNKAYWFGEVVQVVGNGQYRVNVNCKKYQYIGGYSCNDTIYVIYNGDLNLIEDDMVKMWGYMNGNITYETVLGASVTIPNFVAEYVKLQ